MLRARLVLAGPYLQASNSASTEMAFENGPVGNDRRAKLGSEMSAIYARRNHSEGQMVRRAITPVGTKSAPPVDSVADYSPATLKERFSAVIIELRVNENLSRKAIGKIAGVGPETVKAWERGRQIGQFEHIAKLAQKTRLVRRFARYELGLDEDPEFMSPRKLTAIMAAAYQVMHQGGPDGDELRAALMEEMADVYRGLNGPGGAEK